MYRSISRKKVETKKICTVCGNSYIVFPHNRQACEGYCTDQLQRHKHRERQKRFREENPETYNSRMRIYYERNKVARQQTGREWRAKNKERVRIISSRNYYGNIETAVKHKLKKSLGFMPSPELVEEATALRLLRRAIKKAGE